MIHQLVRRAVRQALSGGKTDEHGRTPFAESSIRRILGSIVTTLPTADSFEAESATLRSRPRNPIAIGERSGGALRCVPSSEVVALGQINRTFLDRASRRRSDGASINTRPMSGSCLSGCIARGPPVAFSPNRC